MAFEKTQNAMKEQLHFGHLNYGQTIVVSADASVLGIGGFIGNRYVDVHEETVNRVVACASHAFTQQKKNGKLLIYIIFYFRVVLWGYVMVLCL